MGSYKGAEVCDMVLLFMVNKINKLTYLTTKNSGFTETVTSRSSILNLRERKKTRQKLYTEFLTNGVLKRT